MWNSVENNKSTWENNSLFKSEHSGIYRIATADKILDYIHYKKINPEGSPSITIVNWFDGIEISDHFFIKTELKEGDKTLNVGSFNLQALYGLYKYKYSEENLQFYLLNACKNIDFIGLQEIDMNTENNYKKTIETLNRIFGTMNLTLLTSDKTPRCLTGIVYNTNKWDITEDAICIPRGDIGKGATTALFTNNQDSEFVVRFTSVHLMSKSCEFKSVKGGFSSFMRNVGLITTPTNCTVKRQDEFKKYTGDYDEEDSIQVLVGDFNTTQPVIGGSKTKKRIRRKKHTKTSKKHTKTSKKHTKTYKN